MQIYKNDELRETHQGEVEEFTKLMKEKIKEDEVTHFVVGKIPSKGSLVKVNGLLYEVTYSDKHLGKLHLKIK